MKNIFLVLIAFTLVLFTASCSSQNQSDKKEIVLWTDMTESASIRATADRFEKANEGWKVRIVRVPFEELRAKYQTAGPVFKGPDVITGPHDWIGSFATAKLIAPVELSEEESAGFLEVPLKALSSPDLNDDNKAKLFGLPISIEAAGLIYNKKFVKKAPETMKELIEIAKHTNAGTLEELRGTKYEEYINFDACKGKKLEGFLYEVEDFYFTWAFFGGYGAYIFKDTPTGLDINDVGLDTPEALEAAKYICDLDQHRGKNGIIPQGMSKDIANAKFMENELLFTFNGPWALADFKKRGINSGIAPMPKLDNGQNPSVFVGVQGIYLNSRSFHKEKALEFMKEFCSKEGEVDIYLEGARMPSRYDAQQDPRLASIPYVSQNTRMSSYSSFSYIDDFEVRENDVLKGVLDSASTGTPIPNIVQMNAVWQPMKEAVQLMFRGEMKPEDALKEAETRINKDVKGMME